jgi:hypothetical protein
MQFKPVIFVIIGISLMSLAVTNVLQQQTAMGRPNFPNTEHGNLCSMIYDAMKELEGMFEDGTAESEDIDLLFRYYALYEKTCGDKYGWKDLDPGLIDSLDKLLEDSKVPREGIMDLLEQGMTNTTKNNNGGTNVPEDDGVTKKR